MLSLRSHSPLLSRKTPRPALPSRPEEPAERSSPLRIGLGAASLGALALVQLGSPAQAAETPANVTLGQPVTQSWSVQLSGWETREWTATDERGNWTEFRRGDRHMFQRNYSEGQDDWFEGVEGQNHWRNRAGGYAGLAEEARAQGMVALELPGSPPVEVYGAPTPQELELLRQTFLDLPAAMRPYASKLYLSHHLGEVIDPQGNVKLARGMSGNTEGGIVLDRDYMNEPGLGLRVTKNLIAHESGHNLDRVKGASNQKLWKASGSVSGYGERNPSEDFAETHRFILENWSAYQQGGMAPGTEVQGTRWEPDHAPSVEKAESILQYYR